MRNLERLRGWTVAVVAVCLVQSGCMTFPPPAQYPNLESAYFAAMYQWKVKGRGEKEAEAQSVARDIARRQMPEMGAEATIPELRGAQQVLNSPIVLEASGLNRVSEDVLRGTTREAIAAWVKATPEMGRIDGACLPEWRKAKESIAERIRSCEQEVAKLLADATRLAERGEYAKALEAHTRAARLHPTDAAVVRSGTQIRRQWASARFQDEWPRVAKEHVEAASQLTKGFGRVESGGGEIKSCLANVDAALRWLCAFRTWATGQADPTELVAEGGEWTKNLLQLAELRGRCWAETVRQHAATQNFWNAYEYAFESMQTRRLSLTDPAKPRETAGWHDLSEAELVVLSRHVRGGYDAMLPAALSHLVRKAGESLSQGYSGLSFIHCCMADEILAYGRRIGGARAKDLEPLRNQLQFAAARSTEACEASVARVLLIRDVGIQDATVNELLARIVDAWRQREANRDADGQPLAHWGVVLRRESEGVEVRDRDYVVETLLPQLYVDPVPPAELRAEDVSIGREPREIENPDRKERKDVPILFEQDLIICVRRVTLESKKAVVQGSLTVQHEGRATPLLTLNEIFDGKVRKLAGVTLQDEATDVDQVGLRTVRNPNVTNLVVEPMPAKVPAKLSTDREVRLALIEYVRNASMSAIESLLASYPLTDLLQPAESKRKLGETVESADQYGRCLAYSLQLASREQEVKGKTQDGRVMPLAGLMRDSDWIDRRQLLALKLTQMVQGPWNGSAEPSSQIQNLWDNCVRAALEAK